jgi:hypothetical protein
MFRLPFLLCLVLCAAVPIGTASDPPTGEAKPTRRALLIGVTKYPNLAARLQLEGPANDVVLMKTTLVTHFGVAAENVVTLSEAEGAKKPECLPTRANIAREFKKLAESSRAGDEVIILLGGHGSQQPEKPGAAEPEIDGLDEIFLPRDVGPWSDTVGSVENAITDDDLGAWLGEIRKQKAFIWLVIDACHSGTMMRGGDDVEKPRKADGEGDLKIPRQALAQAAERAEKRPRPKPIATRGGDAKPTSLGLNGRDGVFAIYAAQPTETTPERPMPPGEKQSAQHGVLTYSICQALTQAKTAGSPISYRELGHRIHQQYAAWGRTSPTPMVEHPDTDPDREVLGPGVWKDRSNILLAVENGAYKVNAGQLTGLTAGSVLQVLPPAGTGEKALGHVKVVSPRTIDSDVEPCEYENLPAPKELPPNARCKIVFVDFGEVQIRVAVASHYPSTDLKLVPVPDETRNGLVARLKKAAGPASLHRIVDSPKDAVWLVAPWPDGRVSLLPASGWVAGKDPVKSKGYGPVPTDTRMEAWLEDALSRISRAEGLIQLACDRSQALLQNDDLAPTWTSELYLVDATEKRIGDLPLQATDQTVYDKDKVRLKVTNTGRTAFDLTVLYVDTDHAIGPLFPKRGLSNRVPPKGSLTVPILINGSTIGKEQVVLIAVKSGDREADFTCLAQKGPEKLRDVTADRGSAAGLSKLLERKVYGQGSDTKSRGAGADAVSDHAMGLIAWQVKGTPRPKREPK